jgi:hypothetical protein
MRSVVLPGGIERSHLVGLYGYITSFRRIDSCRPRRLRTANVRCRLLKRIVLARVADIDLGWSFATTNSTVEVVEGESFLLLPRPVLGHVGTA